MERITLKHAKQFISLDDDFTNKTVQDCPHFTLSPSPKGGGDYDSLVYILSNPTQPNLYKIGYTKNTPDERAKQISNATGVALPYKVEWAFHCYDGFGLEQEVHHKLEANRLNSNREFFQIPLEEAKATVEMLGERYL
jgi:hypothetical protein